MVQHSEHSHHAAMIVNSGSAGSAPVRLHLKAKTHFSSVFHLMSARVATTAGDCLKLHWPRRYTVQHRDGTLQNRRPLLLIRRPQMAFQFAITKAPVSVVCTENDGTRRYTGIEWQYRLSVRSVTSFICLVSQEKVLNYICTATEILAKKISLKNTDIGLFWS